MMSKEVVKMQSKYIKELLEGIKQSHKVYEKLVSNMKKGETIQQLENEFRSLNSASRIIELRQKSLENYLAKRIFRYKSYE